MAIKLSDKSNFTFGGLTSSPNRTLSRFFAKTEANAFSSQWPSIYTGYRISQILFFSTRVNPLFFMESLILDVIRSEKPIDYNLKTSLKTNNLNSEIKHFLAIYNITHQFGNGYRYFGEEGRLMHWPRVRKNWNWRGCVFSGVNPRLAKIRLVYKVRYMIAFYGCIGSGIGFNINRRLLL